MLPKVFKPSPVLVKPRPVCAYCGFPVKWEDDWRRGATWNPPSAQVTLEEFTTSAHSECDNDTFTLEMWRGHAP